MPDFYDSTQPNLIPSGAKYVVAYYDGNYAWHDWEAKRFPHVRWITISDNWEECGIIDFEPGNPAYSDALLERYVNGRTSRGKRARVYCDRNDLPRVQKVLGRYRYELWISTLDGDKLHREYVHNLWGVQYYGGPQAPYDVSILYGEW
jgi:hypothetical protein